jgi:hypothetical protein
MQQKVTFNLIFEGQQITVKHLSNCYFTGYDHFEFLSPHQPVQTIPISETGYRSYFAPNKESALGIEAYAYELMTLLMDDENISHRPDNNHLKLF